MQSVDKFLFAVGAISGSVGVLDTQNELPTVMPGKKLLEKAVSQGTDMEHAGRTRGEADSNWHALKGYRLEAKLP
jgi:hypothetical protein